MKQFSPKFLHGIDKKITGIVPVVIIGYDEKQGRANNDSIIISTSQQKLFRFNTVAGSDLNLEDYGSRYALTSGAYNAYVEATQTVNDSHILGSLNDGQPFPVNTSTYDQATMSEPDVIDPGAAGARPHVGYVTLDEAVTPVNEADGTPMNPFRSKMGGMILTQDHDLKISSIKEGINIETKKFTIGNVNITFSNREGFADVLSSRAVVNDVVAIFYKTPNITNLDHAINVFIGKLTRYDHDEKTIKITLEDQSLYKINQDLPYANLGTGDKVYSDKYKNKYIPMTYGILPYAPAIIYPEVPDPHIGDTYTRTGFHVIADDVFDATGEGRNIRGAVQNIDGALSTYRGSYWDVRKDSTNYTEEYDFASSAKQWQTYPFTSPGLSAQVLFYNEGASGFPGNPVAMDAVECTSTQRPQGVELLRVRHDGTPSYLEAPEDFELSNPQYIIDYGYSDTEAQAFGIVNPSGSYAMFPDAERDSWSNYDDDYPEIDVSYGLRDTLEDSNHGNFLNMPKVDWVDAKVATFNWYFGDGYYAMGGGSLVHSGSTLGDYDPIYNERSKPANVTEEDWWSNHKKWKITYAQGHAADMHVNSTVYLPGDGSGEYPMSWMTDSGTHQDYINDETSRWEGSWSIDYNNDINQNDWDNFENDGPGEWSYRKKLWPRTYDMFNYYLAGNPWAEDSERLNTVLMQLPSGAKIAERLEDLLKQELNDPSYELGKNAPGGHYIQCVVLDGNMFSGTYSEHETSEWATQYMRDGDHTFKGWSQLTDDADDLMEHAYMTDADQSLPDPLDKGNGPLWPLQLMIKAARPYGTVAWIIGRYYTNPGYTAAPPISFGDEENNAGGNGQWTNSGYMMYCKDFYVVTMDGRFDIEKWAWWRDEGDDYYENNQQVLGVYALWDLFDLSEFPTGSIKTTGDIDINLWGPNQGGTGSIGEGWHRYENTVDMWYNGKVIDNQNLLGSPNTGGVASQWGCHSTWHDGGVGRWFALTVGPDGSEGSTKDPFFGFTPGVCTPLQNNYHAHDFMGEAGGYWPFVSAGNTEMLSVPEGTGSVSYYFAPSQGFASIENDQQLAFKFEMPAFGVDDIIDNTFRSDWKFDFEVLVDKATVVDGISDTNRDNHELIIFARCFNGENNSYPGYDATEYQSTGSSVLRFSMNDYIDEATLITGEDDPTLSYARDYYSLRFANTGDANIMPIDWNESSHDTSLEDDNWYLESGSELSATARYYPTRNYHYDNESTAGDPWFDPGMYTSFVFEIGHSQKEGHGADVLSFPVSTKIYDQHLEYQGTFSNFKGSNFYIKDYQGRKATTGDQHVITNPAEVISNILKVELKYDGFINDVELNLAKVRTEGWKLGFAIQEKTDAKKLIEDICKDLPLFPRFTSSDEFGFIVINDEYSDADVNATIRAEDVIKYKFTKTKIENVSSLVEVKFDYDYATKEYRGTTGWFSAKDFLGNNDDGQFVNPPIVLSGTGIDIYQDIEYDLGVEGSIAMFQQELNTEILTGYAINYYNLGTKISIFESTVTSEADASKTIEARYITDLKTAEKLQEYYTMFFCNQHLIMQMDLPLRYLNLEAGDVINIDSLIGNTKAYGKNYTVKNRVNGQVVYPYFLIQEISRKTKFITIKAIQLHKLSRDFYPYIGDVNRHGSYPGNTVFVDPENESAGYLPGTLEAVAGVSLITDYIENKSTSRYTRTQMRAMDVNLSRGVTIKDLVFFPEFCDFGYDTENPYDEEEAEAPGPVYGCTDIEASNYNPEADIDDGSCRYRPKKGEEDVWEGPQ